MSTLFQHPFSNGGGQLDGDLNAIHLPPRSASATPCKSSEPFLVDLSRLRAFTLHRSLRPVGANFGAEDSGASDNDSILAPSPQKPYSSVLSSGVEASDHESDSEEAAENRPGSCSVRTQSRSDKLIMSELRSLTRPNSVKGKPGMAANLRPATNAGPFRGFTFTPEPLGGLEGWLSRQNTKELAQLRSDFTPRPTQDISQKYHIPSAHDLNLRPICGKTALGSLPQPDARVGSFGHSAIVNPTPKS